MRSLLIAFLVGVGFLCAKSVVYSPEVVALYLHPEDSKVVGKLLPTNGFEVLQSTPKRVLISLEGYVNPKVPFALYQPRRKAPSFSYGDIRLAQACLF
ncbi:putative cytochrome C-type haem-binding periplasmic protein [Helicobacter bizzozeronii CCUG 35545]|uniref:hypothetical protein n=1 Tax=Helicobacter bizzozeronii TaxID=56877 RepID=UPI00024E5B45|nr:hypothetical protein [Helicobacter bizzozeronii]CCF80970.1 putative cytochrome C-type haem-binding periplasmic protein [Helicobacter bizzozeronii CCUG 35545]